MNWKEYPHLFANGKFEIAYDDGTGKPIPFNGAYDNMIVRSFTTTILGDTRHRSVFVDMDNGVHLIARPMSDMSDDEKNRWFMLTNNDDEDTPKSFLYLLSIGVLPEAYADEDVIWKNQN